MAACGLGGAAARGHAFRAGGRAPGAADRSGKSGTWRNVLSEDQIKRIISDHKEQMERFDYVPKGY